MNRADSLMLNDSLARELADWFDRHGTPNEQLRAYYMLGRTYADRGETPQALEAYNDAVDRADTTAADCNYYTLCRVYAHMAVLFYQQNLLTDNLKCIDKSIRYAYMANDTVAVQYLYGQKIDVFDQLNLPDSVIAICHNSIDRPEIWNAYMAMASNAYIMKGDLSNARRCIDNYEKKSGFFDSQGNIEKGREAYYNIKGKLYLLTGQLDSAEHYFRKELNEGHGHVFQDMAARSLSLLYQRKGIIDSTAKFALYSYEMNDSVYSHMSTETVARIQAMYDYTRSERIANQKSREADRLWFSLLFIVAVLSILSLVFAIVYQRHQSEKRLLEEKIRILKDYTVNERLYNSRVARRFRQLLNDNPYQQPALDDWKELRLLLSAELPAFHDCLNSDGRMLSDFEYDVCMLIKIQISSSGIAKLKQCTPAHVTKTRKAIYQKLFNKKGRANELDEYILSLS